MPDLEGDRPAALPGNTAGGRDPRSARVKTALWWLLGAVCLLAAAGCLLTGNYRSAPCYLVVAAVSLPPVARRLHWKMPDSWRYFLILLGLMGAALLANPPDSLQAPQGKEAVAEPGPGGKGRQPGNGPRRP